MNSQVTPVLREGLSGTHNKGTMLGSFVIRTLPQVQKLLQFWQAKAQGIPDPTLRQQALDSLAHKAFHCQGGAVYAAYPRNAQLLEFIIAYQTMCDYLDNLCDRAGSTDGHAFKQLHQSLLDALDSNRNPTDYYKNYPYQDDGGYLS
jgi:tetraprenyl-beta-curcumene synthase